MGIVDPVGPPPALTTADGARRLRQRFVDIVRHMDVALGDIRRIVVEFGRTELATELGADATPMQTLYTSMKDVLESAEVGMTVDSLPS